jgi:hypothetical protein
VREFKEQKKRFLFVVDFFVCAFCSVFLLCFALFFVAPFVHFFFVWSSTHYLDLAI